MLKTPYLLFLGDAHDQLAAKVGQGIVDWRPENAVGQMRLPGCQADLGIPDLSIEDAVGQGAGTLVVGVANRGGFISDVWIDQLVKALEGGMDLAAGLHNKLADVPILVETAAKHGRALYDVRHATGSYPVGGGAPRSGKRLLPVGTDCSCGKMYTALAIEKEMRARGWNADFRATGQTGILITGDGVPLDAVIADFIAGAIEALSPDNDPDHWDLIEGQGSLFHPAYAGVTAGLIHGSQADALVMCHEPTRAHMRALPNYPVRDMAELMPFALQMAHLTNPHAKFVGIAINTKNLPEDEAMAYLASTEERFSLPTVDPVRTGVSRLVDALA